MFETIIAGVVVSILYSIRSQIMNLLHWFYTKFVYRISIVRKEDRESHSDANDIYNYFNDWIKENYPKKYKEMSVFIKYQEKPDSPYKDYESHLDYLPESNRFLIKYKRKYIMVSCAFEASRDNPNVRRGSITLTTLFSDKHIKELLDEIYYARAYKHDKDVVTVSMFEGRYWAVHKRYKPTPLHKMTFEPFLLNQITSDLETFIANKKFYNDKDIPYRRGYMFEGDPGCGKSSLITALCQKYEISVNYLSLAEQTDFSLREAFKGLANMSVTKGIDRKLVGLIIEEVDTVFKGRNVETVKFPDDLEDDNIEALKDERSGNVSKYLTLGNLLNLLSGIIQLDNVVLFMTTNHLEVLDPALIRPGRIDRIFKLPKPTKTLAEERFSKFYEKTIIFKEYIEIFSYAELQNFCFSNMHDSEKATQELYRALNEHKSKSH